MEPKERMLHMLTSKDPEMQDLAVTTLGHVLSTWGEYNWIRTHASFQKVAPKIRQACRKTFINSHGKLRKKFKKGNDESTGESDPYVGKQ